VAFGFMSLAHGPVMAFAGAGMPAQQHVTSVVAHDHHSRSHHQPQAHRNEQQTSPALPGSPALCYAQGCFTAVSPTVIAAPPTPSVPLGKLVAAPPRVLIATLLDPADPPPRLQA